MQILYENLEINQAFIFAAGGDTRSINRSASFIHFLLESITS